MTYTNIFRRLANLGEGYLGHNAEASEEEELSWTDNNSKTAGLGGAHAWNRHEFTQRRQSGLKSRGSWILGNKFRFF